MNKKNIKTSVDFTEVAQKLKEQYLYLGLKNILSAGLVLFDKQTGDDKLKAITVANGALDAAYLTNPKPRIEKALALIKEIRHDYDPIMQPQGELDVIWFCEKLLEILAEPEIPTETEKEPKQDKPKSLRQALKSFASAAEKQQVLPSMTIKITPSDEEAWDELRRLAEPEKAKQPKKSRKKA